MKALAGSILFLLPLLLSAQSPDLPAPPDPAEQARIISLLRKNALRYQGHLPEFVCTQVTTRSEDSTGTGQHLKPRDVLEERIVFSGGQEDYTLTRINGKPTKKTHDSLDGMFEGGLLGMAIVPNYLFGPQAPASLEWARLDQIDGKPAHVIAFHVAPSVRNSPDGKTTFLIGFHGFAWMSAADGSLMRLERITDGPSTAICRSGTIDTQSIMEMSTYPARSFHLPIRCSGSPDRLATVHVEQYHRVHKPTENFQTDTQTSGSEDTADPAPEPYLPNKTAKPRVQLAWRVKPDAVIAKPRLVRLRRSFSISTARNSHPIHPNDSALRLINAKDFLTHRN